MYDISFFCLSVDRFSGSFQFLAIMHNAAMNFHAGFFCECMSSFILGVILGVELQDHMVTLYIVF